MAQKKKLQVFVSSTYIDLQDERQAAVQAILTAGHIPAGMELFAAGDETQMNVIKRWIDESDVYMLILGGRYGSIEPKSQKSYTHLEYEYAAKQGKPLFAVVISEECLEAKVIKMGDSVKEMNNPKKLNQFRKIVCGKMVKFWNDTKDIKLSILETLADFSSRAELAGWIPGSEAVNSAALAEEIARLTKVNSELRNENSELLKNNSELQQRMDRGDKESELYNGMTFEDLYGMLKKNDLIDFLNEERGALAIGYDIHGMGGAVSIDPRITRMIAELAAFGVVYINRDRPELELAFLSETGKKFVTRLQRGY